jgi:hypothetical protein
MTTFAEILPTLPPVDGIACIELTLRRTNDGGVSIENKPGQAGSLRVYHALWQKHGCIDAAAAREGLALYAEHTADARTHPGKHPNIDRLLQVIAQGLSYDVRVVNQVL